MATINAAVGNIAQKNELSKEKQDTGQLEKAVVVTVITDQSGIGSLKSTYPEIFNTFSPDRIPRNTCIVRKISGGADASASAVVLAYPFFSSHLCMPVKTGETVWIFFDREIKTVGYWMSRVHGDEHNEDLSYSHYDKIYKPQEGSDDSPGTVEKASGDKKSKAPVDDFPNLSLKQKNGKNEYERIVSSSNDPVIYEPIPRFTKRPGDFVIHGSNNSMVLLGTDRYWAHDDTPEESESNALKIPAPFSGIVDIVAGRSRGLVSGSMTRTTPATFKNSRSFDEVVKDPRKGDKGVNSEGDPDFHSDAARIYISMNTSIDNALTLDQFTPVFPGEKEVRPTSVGSAVISKADHIRIVARKDEELGINGTIRIIKEGQLGGDAKNVANDGCSILLHDNGAIHLASNKIYLGLSEVEGGKLSVDENTVQPYVKFQELKKLLDSILKDISSFCNTLSTHVTPGYGMPSPQILSAASTLLSNVKTRQTEIDSIKSERIFGE